MGKIVALEVVPGAIRAAEVHGYDTDKPKLVKVAEFKLEEEVTEESAVVNTERFIDALKDFWAEEKFSTKSVGIIAGGRRFLVRGHTTSQKSLATLRKVLPFEAPGALPPEEAGSFLFDFYPVKEVELNGVQQLEGLVISIPEEPISELALALRKAGLYLEYVDFAPLAVTRWLADNRTESNYMLLNIRDESAEIIFVEDNVPQMIRVIPKGLKTANRKLGASTIEASPLLRRDALGDHSVKVLGQDIEITKNSQDEEFLQKLECVFISGPRAEDFELRALLTTAFGLPIVPLKIEEIENTEDEEKNLKPALDEFVVMCGGLR